MRWVVGIGAPFNLARFSEAVADAAPAGQHGSAYGVFNLFSGLAMLVSSVVAGALWDGLGAPATFLAGAGSCGLTLLVLAVRR